MTKKELNDELDKLGVDHDANATNEVLEALLESHTPTLPPSPADPVAPGAAPAPVPATPASASSEVEVTEPLILRPVDLPLVVKPGAGIVWNAEQQKFAKTLNGFAYSKPDLWKVRRDRLIAQLIQIGKEPALYYVLSGETPGSAQAQINDTRVGQGHDQSK